MLLRAGRNPTGGSRMRAGVHPRVSGLSKAACSPPAPHFHAGNQERNPPAPPGSLPALRLAAAPGTWGGDGGGGGPAAPAAPHQPLISPVRQQLCHQTAVRKFMLSNFLQLGGRQEAECGARHRVLFVSSSLARAGKWRRQGEQGTLPACLLWV